VAKIDEWLEQDKLILLEGWARDGLTYEQISNNMGIDTSTLWDWRKKDSNISNALKKGREVVDFEVENALLKNALSGNVTAQIFWLKNRKKDQWREKIETNDEEKEIQNAKDIVVKIREIANEQRN
jgi:transcriptional regulator with XRE-family HTH domain